MSRVGLATPYENRLLLLGSLKCEKALSRREGRAILLMVATTRRNK